MRDGNAGPYLGTIPPSGLCSPLHPSASFPTPLYRFFPNTGITEARGSLGEETQHEETGVCVWTHVYTLGYASPSIKQL